MKQLFFLEVDDFYNESLINWMLETVSASKKDKLMKYRYAIDRKVGVYAEALLRSLIAKHGGKKNEDIMFEAGQAGKPYVVGAPHIEFNVSHTRNAVAVALSDRPVGIDVERIKPIDLTVAKEIFNENELRWIYVNRQDSVRRFFEIWTQKEAVIKCDGHGLPDDLKATDVMRVPAPKTLHTMCFGEYVVSVCSNNAFSDESAETVTEEELIRLWRQYCLTDSNS